MNAMLFLAVTAAIGVDVGWQPLSDGGVEYIIQIEPQLLDSLATSHDVSSEIPAGLDVRRFRITVGTGRLPRENPPAPAARPASGTTSDARRAPPIVAYSDPTTQLYGDPPPAIPSSAPRTMPADTPRMAVLDAPTPAVPPPAYSAQDSLAPIPSRGAATAPTRIRPLPAAAPAFAPITPLAASAPETGPALSGTPAEMADHVRSEASKALDDPNAPGRAPGDETAQPRLPAGAPLAQPSRAPRTLDPDPASGQLADYTNVPHEAQRQNGTGPNGTGPNGTGTNGSGPNVAAPNSGFPNGAVPNVNGGNNAGGGGYNPNVTGTPNGNSAPSGLGAGGNQNQYANGPGLGAPNGQDAGAVAQPPIPQQPRYSEAEEQAASKRSALNSLIGNVHPGNQPPSNTMHATAGHAAAGPGEPAEKPWGTLLLVGMALLLSFSANVYLGWVAWETRLRYYDLLSAHGGGMPV
jgi:hypothetical protein